MCSGAREWKCWNSIGFDGARLSRLLVDAIQRELHRLDGFDTQFAELVQEAARDGSGDLEHRWQEFRQKEVALNRDKDNVAAAIMQLGPRPMLSEQMDKLEEREKVLTRERQSLEMSGSRTLELPESVGELRCMFEEQFTELTIESSGFADLFGMVVPDIFVYVVRSIDGGHLLPRARVTLNLAGISPDALHVPTLGDMLTRTLTLNLFDPPQRERIREEVVRLAATGLKQKEIASAIDERPTVTAVQRSLALHRKMLTLGLENPYLLVLGPPEDYTKLRKHKNPKYQFEPLDGYQQPEL
jgi:site-specific DNA recombinase